MQAKEARRVFAAPDAAVIVDTADFQYFGATDFHGAILPSPGILSHHTRRRRTKNIAELALRKDIVVKQNIKLEQ